MKYRKENLQKSDLKKKKYYPCIQTCSTSADKATKDATYQRTHIIISELCGGVDDDDDGEHREHIQVYVLDFPYCALAPCVLG